MPRRKQKQHRDLGNADRPSNSPPSLAVSPPSFNAYSSANRLHQIAARVILELGDVRHDDDQLLPPAIPDHELKKLVVADTDDDESCAPADSDDDDQDFEFAFVRRDPDTAEIAADELFSDGQIRPTFPVFGRRSLPDGAAGPSSSAENNTGSIMLPLRKLSIHDTAAAVNGSGGAASPFRMWTPRSPAVPPQPGHCKKSRSTGSSSRRWRLRDLLHRSGSDGKDAFVFLPAGGETLAPESSSPEKSKGKNVIPQSGPRKKKVVGPVSAHELYIRSRANEEGDKRKSFLPYRPGIMGFFASPP